ncbi:MAG TPA: amidohydrolase family protein [Caulobacteraceae bacterium]|jgi:predicted TIM-barrel fold metal-dependent hydrolase|nr:amidohydrolase family protein [Caulobacteraceae bacterium]
MSEPALFIAPRMPSEPARALPEGACDTHTHVFDPSGRFPLIHPPPFALPAAPAPLHRQMLDRAGLGRAILVQPAYYGSDHSALVDALAQGGDRLRGIGVAGSEVADEALAALDRAGVRGLRFSEARNPDGTSREGAVGLDQLPLLAERLRALGWHAHAWASAADLDRYLPALARLDLPLVLDHMAMVEVEAGTAAPSFQRLLGLVREGRVWVKLSLCRLAALTPDYEAARPFHDALVEANPDRLLWGSDWPFIRLAERSPDVCALLQRFTAWVGDAALSRRILVDNPARLFGFP